MIIQCKSCARKYIVKDNDIPNEGRAVKCGYCSVTWYQMPTSKKVSATQKLKEPPKKVVVRKPQNFSSFSTAEASDGKVYKFLGNQWAQLLPSGKIGLFARKAIAQELDEIVGRRKNQTKNKKPAEVNPSSGSMNDENNLPDIYKEKKGFGFFSYIFLIIFISIAVVGLLKMFEEDLTNYFPQLLYFFEIIDIQLIHLNETIKNISTIVKDLRNSY
jgi:predicted Zn finger-like uncharacterized protein